MAKTETLVVGGGAAGMRVAISAADRGEQVTLLEGNESLGRKILISGNGRCNLTNIDADATSHYHGDNPLFARPALESHPVADTVEFFRDLGVETKEEKRGRLFPCSDQAQSVVDVLADRMRVLGVEVRTGAKVRELKRDGLFHLATDSGHRWRAERVVLASGGLSLSKLGADGSGIELAEGLGHRTTPLLPGLVALVSADACVRRMQGVKVRAEVRARLGEPERVVVDTDDLLLTKYGVSGFVILNLSAQIVPLLETGPVELLVNLLPGRSAEEVSELLKSRWEKNRHRSLDLSFAGLLSSKLVRPLLDKLELARERTVDKITKAERWRLAQTLTAWPIVASQPRPFDFAEVTIGGIRTDEIDPHTLESHICPGLYLVGEMVDIHGDLGGYNFQWAWSSAVAAGQRLGN